MVNHALATEISRTTAFGIIGLANSSPTVNIDDTTLPPHLRHVATLPWENKKFKFSADVEENANRLHF